MLTQLVVANTCTSFCSRPQHVVLHRHEQLLRDQTASVLELPIEKRPRRWIAQLHRT